MTGNAPETRVEYAIQEQVGFADQFIDVWESHPSHGETDADKLEQAVADAQRRAAHSGHTTRVRRYTTTIETVQTIVVTKTLTAYEGDPPE